jgi:hypothetical protein
MNKFNTKTSTTFKANDTILTINYTNGVGASGTYGSDNIKIGDSTTNGSFFMVASKNDIPFIDGIIGFPQDLKSEKFNNTSILDQILSVNNKKKRLVAHKVLNATNGQLYLGAYPNELTNGNLTFSKCKANSDWSLKATYVNFGNEYKQLSDGHKLGNGSTSYDFAYIGSGQKNIAAPQYLLPYFLANYFVNTGNYSNNTGTCNVTGLNETTISCPAAVYLKANFTNIFFAFDEAALNIPLADLFTLNTVTTNYDFNIVFGNSSIFGLAENSWYFGSILTSNIITVLDADNANIGFYGATVKDFSSSKTTMFIIIGVGIAIVILAIALIYCYCKKKSDDGGYVAQH